MSGTATRFADHDVPMADPGPDILTLLPEGPLRDVMWKQRADQQLKILSSILPDRHLAKVDEIPLPEGIPTGGAYLHGTRGTGKTQAAVRLVVDAVRRLEVGATRVAWVSTSRMLVDMRRQMSDPKLRVPELDRMRQAKVVVFDDLGKERPSEWVEEQMFVVVDDLYANDVRLIVASNYPPSQIQGRVGEYAADRISEMTTPFEMNGTSHRSTT